MQSVVVLLHGIAKYIYYYFIYIINNNINNNNFLLSVFIILLLFIIEFLIIIFYIIIIINNNYNLVIIRLDYLCHINEQQLFFLIIETNEEFIMLPCVRENFAGVRIKKKDDCIFIFSFYFCCY